MRAESITHTFSARLERLGAAGGSHLVVVPEDVAADLLGGERRGRAIVTLDDVSWHAGVNPYGGGRHYVQVGANYFGPLGYALGDTLTLKLRRDDSPYGMQPCVEFLAVAEADPAGLVPPRLPGGVVEGALPAATRVRAVKPRHVVASSPTSEPIAGRRAPASAGLPALPDSRGGGAANRRASRRMSVTSVTPATRAAAMNSYVQYAQSPVSTHARPRPVPASTA